MGLKNKSRREKQEHGGNIIGNEMFSLLLMSMAIFLCSFNDYFSQEHFSML